MGTARQAKQIVANTCLGLLISVGSANVSAQEPEASSSKPAHERTATDQNGTGTGPTHAPQPDLRPLFAWNFVMKGNAAFVAARREHARLHSNKRIEPIVTKSHHEVDKGHHGHAATRPARPAGAGKYVACVITCADVETRIAPMLGLADEDVLVLRLAGPFVNAEAIALIERTIEKHRLCLVLVLSHERCDSLRPHPKGPEDALDRRVAALRGHARLARQTLAQSLCQKQRELMLASSRTLNQRTQKDQLRIVPGVIDERTGAIAWHHRRAQGLPLAPVK